MTLLLGLLAGLTLAACRVDIDVIVQIGPDGTGEVVVTAVADADLVQRVPGLAEDLRLDDAVAAGWEVDGPGTTTDGGLTVTIRHPVTSVADANNALASLGPPFVNVRFERQVDDDDPEQVTLVLSGQLQLNGGFNAFADSGVLAATGDNPYSAELTASGATPAASMSIELRTELPGELVETTGSRAGNTVTWEAPLDGTAQDLSTITEQRPDRRPGWAVGLSWLALAALVAWLLVVAAVGTAVVRARRRRATRRERSLSRFR